MQRAKQKTEQFQENASVEPDIKRDDNEESSRIYSQ